VKTSKQKKTYSLLEGASRGPGGQWAEPYPLVGTSPGACVSASCWDPARVLLTVHHEGNYCEHSWARMAEKLLVGVGVHDVLCGMENMRLEQELLRLPDSDPQLYTTCQALEGKCID